MPQQQNYPSDTIPTNNDIINTWDSTSGATKSMTRGDFLKGAPLPAKTVDSQALNPTKSVDANGWTVYDYGNWKEYHLRITGNPPSIDPNGNYSIGAPSYPVGITSVSQVYINLTGATGFREMNVVLDSNSGLNAAIFNAANSAINATYYTVDYFLKDK